MVKLVPDNPSEVMVIRKVTPNITTLSLPFWRFGRLRMGGRATLGKSSVDYYCEAFVLKGCLSEVAVWWSCRVFARLADSRGQGDGECHG